MGLPVTVYRSTDEGAPQLVNFRPSEVVEIFKKCLVEGYGEKPPLGWTLEFEDVGSAAAAFRCSPTDGSGGFIKIEPQDSDTASSYFKVDACQSMTDIDTLIKPVGYRAWVLSSYYQSAGMWQLIGTSTGFWFMIPGNYGNADFPLYKMGSNRAPQYSPIMFFGDIESAHLNDVGRFTLLSRISSAGDYHSSSYPSFFGYSYDNYLNFGSVDGSDLPVEIYRSDFPYGVNNTKYSNVPEDDGLGHFLHPFVIKKQSGTLSPSTAMPFVRGTIPGIFQSSQTGYAEKSIPYDLTIGDSDYTLLYTYASNELWINTVEWYV